MSVTQLPNFVQRYMELLEMHRKMKAVFNANEKKLDEALTEVKPHVQNWLNTIPNGEWSLVINDPAEKDRYGCTGKLAFISKEEQKSLTYQKLNDNLKTFFQQVMHPQMPNVSHDSLMNFANLCSDFCWVNRETVHKQRIRRIYIKDRMKPSKRKRLEMIDNIQFHEKEK
jgi:hypothetical protein